MRKTTGLLAFAFSIVGCDPDAPPDAEPELALVDSVVLEEPKESPIGFPAEFAVDEEGRIALVDLDRPGALLFTAEGEHVNNFGSEGAGPGELESVRLVVFLPENQLGLVGEGGERGVFVFDIESGEHVRTHSLAGVPTSATPVEDGFLFGRVSHGENAAGVRFRLSTSEEESVGFIPEEYSEGGPVGGIFPRVFIVPTHEDGHLIGFEPLERVFHVREESDQVDSVRIPAYARRGAPEEQEERLLEAMREGYEQVFAQGSVLHWLSRSDAPGEFTLVHVDLAAQVPAVPEAAYMTVLRLDSREACVDIPVPVTSDAPAAFTWDQGRLGVLQQEIEAGGEAPTRLRWYEVNLDPCDWRALE